MPRHRPDTPVIALTMALALALAACGGKAPTPIPARILHPPATLLPLSTDTPEPSRTPEPTEAGAEGTGTPAAPHKQSQLPAGKDVPVVQIARVDPLASEPGLLAEMAPDFSLQAGGFGVFSEGGGASATDWYQTVLRPDQVQDFVRLLVDDIGVLRMAKARGDTTAYDMGRDAHGKPLGPDAIGVVYVRTATDEGRLILTLQELTHPTDPAMQRLVATLIALEIWKAGVRVPYTPEQAAYVSQQLGWWSDIRMPWTPAQVIGFGVHAEPGASSPTATWPLTADLATLFPAAPGEHPDLAVFGDSDAATLLIAQSQAQLNPNEPLWRSATDRATRWIVGLRPSVPGGNHIWFPFTLGVAAAGAAPSASAPTTVPGSAAGRPTATPSASATP